LKLLEKVYNEAQIIQYVEQQVGKVAHLITNTEKLEQSIYGQLRSYYSSGKPCISWARRLVDREIKTAKQRYGKQDVIMFSDLAVAKEGDVELEFEPESALAGVEETAIKNFSLNEMIAALASDDRERFVLKAWTHGYNDSEISLALASQFGGNPKSLRVFVSRFKVRCRTRLNA